MGTVLIDALGNFRCVVAHAKSIGLRLSEGDFTVIDAALSPSNINKIISFACTISLLLIKQVKGIGAKTNLRLHIMWRSAAGSGIRAPASLSVVTHSAGSNFTNIGRLTKGFIFRDRPCPTGVQMASDHPVVVNF